MNEDGYEYREHYLGLLDESLKEENVNLVQFAVSELVKYCSQDRRLLSPVTDAFKWLSQKSPERALGVTLAAFGNYAAAGSKPNSRTLVVHTLRDSLHTLFNKVAQNDSAKALEMTTKAARDLHLHEIAPDIVSLLRTAESTMPEEKARFWALSKSEFLTSHAANAAMAALQGSPEETEAANLFSGFAASWAKAESKRFSSYIERLSKETEQDPEGPLHQAIQRVIANNPSL